MTADPILADMEYEYFTVKVMPKKPASRKTYRYSITSKRGDRLGYIQWNPQWRQYCFYPADWGQTIWSERCLADIIDNLKALRKARDA